MPNLRRFAKIPYNVNLKPGQNGVAETENVGGNDNSVPLCCRNV